MNKRPTRSEVPKELTWNLDDLYQSDEEWEKGLVEAAAQVSEVTKYKGRLGEGPKVFLECVEATEKLQTTFSRVMAYASLRLAGDGTDPANQVAAGRVGALAAKVSADTSFFTSEALALPEGTLERYMEEDPEIASIGRFIKKLLQDKSHMLNPETEVALASLSEVLGSPSLVYNRSKAADMTFESIKDSQGVTHPMSFALYEETYEKSPDFTLRRAAYESFVKGLKAYQNTFGTTWGTEVKKNVIMAKLRGYRSATHMHLERQEVSEEVYDSLHDVILGELAPHMRRYAQLRKKVLGLSEMLYCDIEAPLDPEFNPEVTYEEASDLILDGLSVLGPEYTAIMDEGLKNRWIDLADNVGKSTGAFTSSIPEVHPYILITWTGSLRNALILAHELGHAGQGVMAQRYQRLTNSRPSMFFIEAPSTINELLVGNRILAKTTDKRMRRWLIMGFLMTYYHNFVRHLIEGELQRRIYVLAEKGQPITASVLSRVQGEILDWFWGGELVIDDGAKLTWMRQPHYYMGLYPYSYSAGLTVGTAVAKDIEEKGASVAENWVEVLKAGGTKSPIDLAKMAGVDMTNPDSIRKAVAYVGSLVDEVIATF